MTEQKVKVGQVWADNDKRAPPNRRLRVIEVDRVMAFCEVFYEGGPELERRRTAIKLSRFRPNSTGYRLVSEVK